MTILAYINKTVPIPNIESIKPKQVKMGQVAATKGNKLLSHITGVRQTWSIVAEELTKAEYDAIITALEGANYGPILFWIRSFGGDAINNSIMAIVDVEDDEEVSFKQDGTFYYDGHTISLSVQAVDA
jgi:hypothetical protein